MTTSAEQMRAWRGPALLSFGFRPFFLGGALWTCFAMVLWIAMLTGLLDLPLAMAPVEWHAHEFLFGFTGAVIAGFLLTAVPNWTGRLPVVGWKLGLLGFIWCLGRVGMALSATAPVGAALLDLAFPILLGAMILREIIAGKNWRNLVVMGLLAVFTLANALFHLEVLTGRFDGEGQRLGVATVVMMIAVIGGRVVPSFTRNWLVAQGHDARPVPPMQRFDKAVLLVSAAAFLAWVVAPYGALTGAGLIVAGLLHLQRMGRWKGGLTLGEPLLWVLHLGYLFVPLGALAIGFAILRPDVMAPHAAQHLWMAGAFGVMTLAMMSRSTLGHTGQALCAGAGTLSLYIAVTLSVGARVAAGVWPDLSMPLYTLSAVLWIAGFGGFAMLYGPLLMRPKPPRRG